MNKKESLLKFIFGFVIFAGLFPLTFTFSQNNVVLLQETPFRFIIWVVLMTSLLLLLFIKVNLSKKQLIGLAIIYICVPFTFTFSSSGISFLILDKYPSTIITWMVASVLLSKLFLKIKNSEINNY